MKRRKLVAPNGPGHRVKPCSGVQNERAPDLRTEAHSFRNAQDETRTRKGRSPADFESAASTNSATQARTKTYHRFAPVGGLWGDQAGGGRLRRNASAESPGGIPLPRPRSWSISRRICSCT